MHCTMSILAHVCAYAIDHVKPEPEIKKEHVQWAFGGAQSSSCKEANIVVIKTSPDASHPILDFDVLINIFMIRMIVH
jgi:hypothetical protein